MSMNVEEQQMVTVQIYHKLHETIFIIIHCSDKIKIQPRITKWGTNVNFSSCLLDLSAGAKAHDGGPGSAGEELPHKEGGASCSGDAELQGFNQKHRRV